MEDRAYILSLFDLTEFRENAAAYGGFASSRAPGPAAARPFAGDANTPASLFALPAELTSGCRRPARTCTDAPPVRVAHVAVDSRHTCRFPRRAPRPRHATTCRPKPNVWSMWNGTGHGEIDSLGSGATQAVRASVVSVVTVAQCVRGGFGESIRALRLTWCSARAKEEEGIDSPWPGAIRSALCGWDET
ncbi:hypothetical protein GUJ93_ZPchr0014g47147 [Zizania palustris]|uniref:Uncharacterized protein n=1 Tax=Zizania palustris TaxID=103762 RepID=A0A8J5SX77_ZIZPA|nr:hypothetical protein GUJ93_ZPchr0014g47147 [Zizania palustris]